MATVAAKGRMAGLARQRIAEAGPQLASRLGVAWPEPAHAKDPDIRNIRELESFAEFLESAAAASGALVDGAADQIAALRQQITDEVLASLPVDESDGEAAEFDIVAAYEAYRADERANGDDDQIAFQDAVLGVFGVSVAACPDDCGCADGECALDPIAGENDTPPLNAGSEDVAGDPSASLSPADGVVNGPVKPKRGTRKAAD